MPPAVAALPLAELRELLQCAGLGVVAASPVRLDGGMVAADALDVLVSWCPAPRP